ncbi:MAG: SpoIID/LytB domain-containing protein [Bacillota bacterium]|nr:MAG: SpoIID/LytB domain-containing protein [Bacillota bacterium]
MPSQLIRGITHGLASLPGLFLPLVRITVEATGPIPFRWFPLSGPARIVIDFEPAGSDLGQGTLEVGAEPVKAVRWAAHPGSVFRVVLDLTRPAPFRAFWEQGPDRLVVEVDRLAVNLLDHATGLVRALPAGDYLAGVLGAEVPASFAAGALEAQAVAARTYTFRRLRAYGGPGCSRHAQADICSDPGHCQGYRSPNQLREAWGDGFEENWARVRRAVEATRRLFLSEGPRPANTVYHSTCGGHTASAEEVWGVTVPYLTGVPCDYCRISPRYTSTKTVALDRAAELTGGRFLAVTRSTGSGRAAEVVAGGRTMTGVEFRQALGLDSTLVEAVNGDLTVFTRGFGHGVGLCQWGAEGQARLGRGFRDILTYYYPGTTLAGEVFQPPAGGPGDLPSPPAPGPEPPPGDGPHPPSEPVVVLDPGHGGDDPGAVGPSGLREKEVNLGIALAAAERLKGRVEVHMTRREDRTVPLRSRTDLADSVGADLFVSVHNNASMYPEAEGTETYHYPGSETGRLLATRIHHRLVTAIARRDRGVKQANFFVLRETHCPAALMEGLFLTNPAEERFLRNPAFQARVGAALGEGILDYVSATGQTVPRARS